MQKGIKGNKIHEENVYFSDIYINLGGGLGLGPTYSRTFTPNGV